MEQYTELLELFNTCYETRIQTGTSSYNHCYFDKLYLKDNKVINTISIVNRSYNHVIDYYDPDKGKDLPLIQKYGEECEDDQMIIATSKAFNKATWCKDEHFIEDILSKYYDDLNINYNEYADHNINEEEQKFLELNNIKKYGELWFSDVKYKPHYLNGILTIQSMYINISWIVSEFLNNEVYIFNFLYGILINFVICIKID